MNRGLRTQVRKSEDIIENLTAFNMDIYKQDDDTTIDELDIIANTIDMAIVQIELDKEELEEVIPNEN